MTVWFFATCFLTTLVVHRLLVFVLPRGARQKVAGLSCCLGALIILVSFRLDSWPLAVILSVTANHIYFHFFNMSETARRIKLLLQVGAGEDPRSTYSSHQIIEKRVNRLLDLGVISCGEGNFYLRKKGLARIAFLMRRYERLLFPERA